MKLFTTLILATLLSGCFWQSVDHRVIKAVEQLCAQHGGIKVISSEFSGNYTAVCADSSGIKSEDIHKQLKLVEHKLIQSYGD